jgi:VIT1/CCC1 family predicted Fe2+/Mn2+ transporter
MLRLRQVSFGAPAAIVTSMGLIVGLNAATAGRAAVVGSLLIIAVADNLTDSLGIHVYQESERLAERDAFRTTVSNFLVRLFVSLSFVLLALLFEAKIVIYVAVTWGLLLLSALSYLLARARNVSPIGEICKHGATAVLVLLVSRQLGLWIPAWLATLPSQ